MKRSGSPSLDKSNKRIFAVDVSGLNGIQNENTQMPGTSRDLNNNPIPLDHKVKIENFKILKELFPHVPNEALLAITNRIKNVPNQKCLEKACNLLLEYSEKNENNTVQQKNSSNIEPIDLNADSQKISSIINDCMPDYILQELKKIEKNPNRVEIVISKLIEKRNYPKIKDKVDKENRKKENERILNMKLDLKEFYKIYPNSREYFYDIQPAMSQNYKEHCKIKLMNMCPYLSDESIFKTLSDYNFHFTPAYKELQRAYCNQENSLKGRIHTNVSALLKNFGVSGGILNNNENSQYAEIVSTCKKITFQKNHKKYKLENTRRKNVEYPNELNERFFQELLYINNEERIDAYTRQQNASKIEKLDYARKNNLLVECSCCYDDEVLSEDMLSCPKGHYFCRTCIKRYTETTIGDSKYKFKCINDTCETEFSLEVLHDVLDTNLFNNLIRNRQNEEIKSANLDGLESCPFCTYAVIIENPDEKIFSCLNPNCMKETCRLCHEINHLPLRCNEIEKKNESNMRTFIENKISEAMLRTCWKCNKRFYKLEGCNMMHCVCGAAMCYVCRNPIKGYNHFGDPELGKCPQYSDVVQLHKIEMEKALKEANEKYLQLNPNAVNIKLKFDPKRLIDEQENVSYSTRVNEAQYQNARQIYQNMPPITN